MRWGSIDLDRDLLTNRELGINSGFSSDEDRRAAFRLMLSNESGFASDAQRIGFFSGGPGAGSAPVSQKEMRSQGGKGAESHTGRKGVQSHTGRDASDRSQSSGGLRKGVDSHTGRSGPSSRGEGGSTAFHEELKAKASEASALAVKHSGIAGKVNKDRQPRSHARAADSHEAAAHAHATAGQHSLAEMHTKAAGEHRAKAGGASWNTHGGLYAPYSVTGGGHMALSANQRADIIDELTANSRAWQSPGDDDVLNALDDAKLIALHEAMQEEQQATAVANAAVAGFADGKGNAFRINPDTGRWEHRRVDNADGEDDDPPPFKKGKKGKPFMSKKEDDEEDAEDGGADEEVETNVRRSSRPRTMEDWVRHAPAEVQNTFRYAQQIESREKDALITKLLVNVAESQRAAHREYLRQRPLDELHNLLALVPQQPTTEELEAATGRRPTGNRRSSAGARRGGDDLLTMPTIDWKSEDGTSPNGNGNGDGTSGASSPLGNADEMNEDDFLRSAPPNIRSAIQNAMAIESREKRKLIDDLIANFTGDEEAERRLHQRLQNKSLDELRDLSALTPRRDSRTPSYLGAAGTSVTPVGNRADSDDVLPLPTINWKEDGKKRNGS